MADYSVQFGQIWSETLKPYTKAFSQCKIGPFNSCRRADVASEIQPPPYEEERAIPKNYLMSVESAVFLFNQDGLCEKYTT